MLWHSGERAPRRQPITVTFVMANVDVYRPIIRRQCCTLLSIEFRLKARENSNILFCFFLLSFWIDLQLRADFHGFLRRSVLFFLVMFLMNETVKRRSKRYIIEKKTCCTVCKLDRLKKKNGLPIFWTLQTSSRSPHFILFQSAITFSFFSFLCSSFCRKECKTWFAKKKETKNKKKRTKSLRNKVWSHPL